jgi:hypothetical protein
MGFAAPLTVIVHGYQYDGNFPGWVPDMVAAIAHRTGLDVGGSGDVLYLDWADTSNIQSNGWAEAAAHELVAGVLDRLMIDGVERDIHFIGHSRGAVVISQAIKRLAPFKTSATDGARLVGRIQMTTLDPHPANHDPISIIQDPDRIFDAVDPPVVVWDDVDFADSYFQHTMKENLGVLDPQGQNVNGASNLDVSPNVANWIVTRELYSKDYESDHSDVHDWYHWTIDTDGIPNSPLYTDEYLMAEEADFADGSEDRASLFTVTEEGGGQRDGESGRTIGFYDSLTQPGGASMQPPTSTVPIGDVSDVVFNGDFAYEYAAGGTSNQQLEGIPGFVGNVFPDALYEPDEPSPRSVHLSVSPSSQLAYLRTDPLFLPRDAQWVSFILQGQVPRGTTFEVRFLQRNGTPFESNALPGGSFVTGRSTGKIQQGGNKTVVDIDSLFFGAGIGAVGVLEFRLIASAGLSTAVTVELSNISVEHAGTIIPHGPASPASILTSDPEPLARVPLVGVRGFRTDDLAAIGSALASLSAASQQPGYVPAPNAARSFVSTVTGSRADARTEEVNNQIDWQMSRRVTPTLYVSLSGTIAADGLDAEAVDSALLAWNALDSGFTRIRRRM